jgi:hypothetical protein
MNTTPAGFDMDSLFATLASLGEQRVVRVLVSEVTLYWLQQPSRVQFSSPPISGGVRGVRIAGVLMESATDVPPGLARVMVLKDGEEIIMAGARIGGPTEYPPGDEPGESDDE